MTDVTKVCNPTLYSNAMSAPAFAVFALLLRSERFSSFARINLLTQLAVFIPCVQIPTLMTGRLTYVDIAWPTGLLSMGIVSFFRKIRQLWNTEDRINDEQEDPSARRWSDIRGVMISLAYIFQGGRMAFGAWTMFFAGHMRKEMQRYSYQRLRWSSVGISQGSFAEVVEMQKEAFTQCLANLGPLSVPLALQTSIRAGPLQLGEVLSWTLWVSSFIWEHMSDLQKVAFAQAMKKQGLRKKVCDYGFWKYSRHPNYFGEWMVWVALALASLPSLKHFLAREATPDGQKKESSVTLMGLRLSLLLVPASMYLCLVHWTGAVPAEHYSMQNRPDYAQYCREVNCFFPGPRRSLG